MYKTIKKELQTVLRCWSYELYPGFIISALHVGIGQKFSNAAHILNLNEIKYKIWMSTLYLTNV